MEYLTLTADEILDGENLVREVFFDAGNLKLSQKAAQSFLEFLSANGKNLGWIGAYDQDLKGILAYEKQTFHISLLFVRRENQKTGIARGLFETFLTLAKENQIQRITINAIKSSVPVYQKLGFDKAGTPFEAGGMTVQLMEYLVGAENLGKKVTVTIDRPYGSFHPHIPDLLYTCNFGYVDDMTNDNFQDAYVYGPQEAMDSFTGFVIGIIYHRDEVETKWIVASGLQFDEQDVINCIGPMEQDYDIRIQWIK